MKKTNVTTNSIHRRADHTGEIVLGYFQAIFSGTVIFGAAFGTFLLMFHKEVRNLIKSVTKISFAGAEVFTQQESSARAEVERANPVPALPPAERPELPDLPPEVTAAERNNLTAAIESEAIASRLWEFRYLNKFLVLSTQRVLDWFIGLPRPITYRAYDTYWAAYVGSAQERQAIINALESHHLINLENNLMQVTAKGREYAGWRGAVAATGALPPPPAAD
jgi:hypothetical protein